MRMAHRLLAVLIAATFTLLAGCGGESSGDGPSGRFVLASGGQTGVYYPTANAIKRLAKKQADGLLLDVPTTGGSVANARMLAKDEAQFAVMQNDIAVYARQGQLMFKEDGPDENLMGVAALYPEHVQIVARADADIATVDDLAGKRIAIGAVGSGTEANALQILQAYGIAEADLAKVERLKASEARDYLQDNRVDAAFFTFGVGTAAILDLAQQTDIALVPVTGDARTQLMENYTFYRAATIPAGSYPGVDADVPTVSVIATLVCRKDVPADVVEAVLRGIFMNLDEFKQAHARLADIDRNTAEAYLAVPAHEGAKAFYGK